MQNAQPRLTVLTYNVWFDNFEFDRRVAEILRLVEASRPDVVLLQETKMDADSSVPNLPGYTNVHRPRPAQSVTAQTHSPYLETPWPLGQSWSLHE